MTALNQMFDITDYCFTEQFMVNKINVLIVKWDKELILTFINVKYSVKYSDWRIVGNSRFY